MKQVIKFALLVIFLTSSVGCFKKSDPGKSDSKILSLLPQNTLGFYTWANENSGYKKFKSSPWFNPQISSDTLKQTEFKHIISILERIGVLGAGAQHEEVIRSGLFFVENTSPTEINLALYLFGNDEAKTLDYVKTLRSEISKDGIPVKDSSNKERNGFIVEISDSKKGFPASLLITEFKGIITIASNESLSVAPFNHTDWSTLRASILTSPSHADLLKHIYPDSSFAYGMFDLAGSLKYFLEFVPPEAQVALRDLPIQTLSLVRTYQENLEDWVGVHFDASNEAHKSLLSTLHSSSSDVFLKYVPGNAIASISTDGQTLSNIAALDPTNRSASLVSLKGNLQRMGISAKPASVGSMFPDLSVILLAQDPKALSKIILDSIRSLTASGGFSPWTKVTIEGYEFESSLTPLGIGIFAGIAESAVIISSSSEAAKSSVLSIKDRSDSLAEFYGRISKLTGNSNLAQLTINFHELSKAISDAQGTLAMFSGGSANVDLSYLEELKKLGKLIVSLEQAQNLISIKASYTN